MDHISFSQLNTYLKCGEQYRRRWIQKEIIAPSGSMVRGRSCHKSEEINFIQKIKTRSDLPVDQVKDIFSDEWENRKYEIQWTEEELDGNSPKKIEGLYKDTGVNLIQTYHTKIAPKTNPMAVEEKFTVHFQGGYPDLTGIIDRIDYGDEITDLKFVGKSPPADDLEKDIQLTAYNFGFIHTFRRKPKLLRKEYSIALKTKIKTDIKESEPRDEETLNRFLRRLESAMIAIQRGDFLPASHGWWGCSPRYCGFWQSCKVRP